jgi:hypothetical protein
MRRGQVTLLLIVAALVVVSAFFAFYLADLALPDPTTRAFQASESDTATRLCLEEAGTQAIMQALSEGGVNYEYWKIRGNVYTNDTGSKTRTNYRLGSATTVELGEGPDRGTDYDYPDGTVVDAWAPQEYLETPTGVVRFWIFRGRDYLNHWPEEEKNEFTLPSNKHAAAQSGPYMGKLRPEPLCARTGFNRPGADTDGSNTCLPGTYKVGSSPEKSWQEALQDRITAKTKELETPCELPAPVSVALGEDDVTLISGNTSVVIDIRLKRMYNLAYNLAKYEMSDPAFDPATITGEYPSPKRVQPSVVVDPVIRGCQDRAYGGDCAVPGLKVTVSYADDPFEKLDNEEDAAGEPWNGLLEESIFEPHNDAWRQQAMIVTITDTTKRVDNRNPALRFAVKNRYPLALGGGGGGSEYEQRNNNNPLEKVTLGGVDPDGKKLHVSCYEKTTSPGGSRLLPDCDGTKDKETTALWKVDAIAYCDSIQRVRPLCPVQENCQVTQNMEPVPYIICSESTRTNPDTSTPPRKVPADWSSWFDETPPPWSASTNPPSPPGSFNKLPRNCRVAYAKPTTECQYGDVEQRGLTPEQSRCYTCTCPEPATCPITPTCNRNTEAAGCEEVSSPY